MAWVDLITFRINTERNNPAQLVNVKIQYNGTQPTGAPFTDCIATADGNSFAYRGLSNNYNNTQMRSRMTVKFIPINLPSWIEAFFSQRRTVDIRVQLSGSLVWQGFYAENSFRLVYDDNTPQGTIYMEFTDGLERLDNIQYSDVLGREVTVSGPDYYTTTIDVLANIFNLAGYGTNDSVHEYTFLGYRALAQSWLTSTSVWRNSLTDSNGNFFSCGTILNNILLATNSFIVLDNENLDRFYVVTNNYIDFIGQSSNPATPSGPFWYSMQFNAGPSTQNQLTVAVGQDIRDGVALGIKASIQNSIVYKDNILSTPGGQLTRNYGWGNNTEYTATVSADYANQAGDTYGLLSFPAKQTFNQWEQPNFNNPQTALRDKTVDWFYGGYGDGSNFRKPYYVNYSFIWNIATPYGPQQPWFGIKDGLLGNTSPPPTKFQNLKVISMKIDLVTLNTTMRCIGYHIPTVIP